MQQRLRVWYTGSLQLTSSTGRYNSGYVFGSLQLTSSTGRYNSGYVFGSLQLTSSTGRYNSGYVFGSLQLTSSTGRYNSRYVFGSLQLTSSTGRYNSGSRTAVNSDVFIPLKKATLTFSHPQLTATAPHVQLSVLRYYNHNNNIYGLLPPCVYIIIIMYIYVLYIHAYVVI